MTPEAMFGAAMEGIIATTGIYLAWQRFGAPWLTWYSGRWKHVPPRRAPEWPRRPWWVRAVSWFVEGET